MFHEEMMPIDKVLFIEESDPETPWLSGGF